jgi:hypothetical protein
MILNVFLQIPRISRKKMQREGGPPPSARLAAETFLERFLDVT